MFSLKIKSMKKFLLVTVILILFAGITQGYSQTLPTYPIPSFNVVVNGDALFRENAHSLNSPPAREKRDVNVEVKSASGSMNCQATVWVYSLDHTTVLGPYTVNCGATLTVGIDEREWGVLVESDDDIIVDIWIFP
jgi:hypothetical protein